MTPTRGPVPQHTQPPTPPVPAQATPDTAPGVVLLDGQALVCSMDATAERMFTCRAEKAAGQTFDCLLVPTPGLSKNSSNAQVQTTAWLTCAPEGVRALGRRADGASFPLRLFFSRLAPVVNNAAQPCYVVMVHDLSHEPGWRVELQGVERRLRTLIELAPIAIWVAEDDQVVLANRAAGELLGLASGSTLVGQSIYELLSTGDHADLRRRLLHAVSHEGQVAHMQARLVRQDNEIREVEIALAALPDHGRTTVQMVVANVSQRNLELRDVQRSRQLLKRLSANLVEAREEERRRIARELHDELSQGLGALKMDIAHCAESHALPADGGRVEALLTSLDGILASVRRIASDLRPPMLDDLGLGDAIDALARDFARRQGLRIRLRLDTLDPPPDEKVAIALYRMVQEALTNIARHSGANEVQIDLHRAAGEVTLKVHDDGVGLRASNLPQRDSQFGLLGMQERADALGGRLQIDSPANGGLCLVVHLPVDSTGMRDRAQGAPSPVRGG